nr:hypothetical protein [Tanacetum cinerariifolium]
KNTSRTGLGAQVKELVGYQEFPMKKKDNDGDDHISNIQDTDDEDAETKSNVDEIYKYKIYVRKVSRLKLVRIREDYQEYILHILDMMLNDKIKQLESNQMFIKYSTGHIPPRRADAKNRSRGTSEGTGRIPGVPDESIVISSTLSEGNEKKDNDGDADDEGDDHISNIQDTDDEDAETKSNVDEIYKYKIYVRKVSKLEKDVSELNKIDHSAEALTSLKSQVPTVVEHYLGSKIGDGPQMVLQRHTAYLI